MLSLASELVTFRLREGFQRKGWGMAGFSGFQSQGVQYGKRQHEVIVRLSGDLAHTHWRVLYALANSCTRLDFECTTTSDECPARRVSRAYSQAVRHARRKKKGPAVTIVRCTTGGSTCYLGKRQSVVFGRIYDKEAESKDKRYLGAVRYELEMKGRMAQLTVAHLDQQRYPTDTIAGNLTAFLRARGIPSPLPGGL
jgi:DNA relaxase NicK